MTGTTSSTGTATGTASSSARAGDRDFFPEMVFEFVAYLWARARDELDTPTLGRGRPTATAAIAAVVVAGVLAVWVGYWLITTVLSWIGSGIARVPGAVDNTSVPDFAEPALQQAQTLSTVVTTPVRDYLTAHAAGLPLSADALWWTWCWAGVALFALALTRSLGARIGWALYGAATTAAVAVTTPGPAATTAAALTALAWTALTIPAYRSPSRRYLVLRG